MNSKKALHWICNLLDGKQVPYSICGGLAAISYGSKRELNDIDIFIPDRYFDEIFPSIKEFITYGPFSYKDNYWQVKYAQLSYYDQKIEIGSDKNVMIFDTITNTWRPLTIDFDNTVLKTVYGVKVKVMDKNSLISYKTMLSRAVDIEDIGYINLFA